MADVRVENYGNAPRSRFSETIDFYGGRPHPDTWRTEAEARIEKIRKGDATIRVVDANGKPVSGANVHIEQTRHHFRFGSAVPASRLLGQEPDNVRFREEVKRLYNVVVFENDLKWTDQFDGGLAQVREAAAWLKKNNIAIRGHNLVWGSDRWMPARTQSMDVPTLTRTVQERIKHGIESVKGLVYIWDVVNEAATERTLWEKIGWENFANAYKWAREADPTVLLCYNDYNISDDSDGGRQFATIKERVRYLLDHNAPLDVLGDQGHMNMPFTPIDRVLGLWEEYAAFGKPLEITEFDLGCLDDKMHGAYVRDYLIAAFSQPKIESFLFWGFWEGAHWRAKEGGAMFRLDWSKRPAELAYEDLVFKQWWTRADLKTNGSGHAKTRAFYGTHRVTVTHNGKTVEREVVLVPGKSGELVVTLN